MKTLELTRDTDIQDINEFLSGTEYSAEQDENGGVKLYGPGCSESGYRIFKDDVLGSDDGGNIVLYKPSYETGHKFNIESPDVRFREDALTAASFAGHVPENVLAVTQSGGDVKTVSPKKSIFTESYSVVENELEPEIGRSFTGIRDPYEAVRRFKECSSMHSSPAIIVNLSEGNAVTAFSAGSREVADLSSSADESSALAAEIELEEALRSGGLLFSTPWARKARKISEKLEWKKSKNRDPNAMYYNPKSGVTGTYDEFNYLCGGKQGNSVDDGDAKKVLAKSENGQHFLAESGKTLSKYRRIAETLDRRNELVNENDRLMSDILSADALRESALDYTGEPVVSIDGEEHRISEVLEAMKDSLSGEALRSATAKYRMTRALKEAELLHGTHMHFAERNAYVARRLAEDDEADRRIADKKIKFNVKNGDSTWDGSVTESISVFSDTTTYVSAASSKKMTDRDAADALLDKINAVRKGMKNITLRRHPGQKSAVEIYNESYDKACEEVDESYRRFCEIKKAVLDLDIDGKIYSIGDPELDDVQKKLTDIALNLCWPLNKYTFSAEFAEAKACSEALHRLNDVLNQVKNDAQNSDLLRATLYY